MESGSSFIISMVPIYILLFVIIPMQNRTRIMGILRLRKKRKEVNNMSNELLESYVGKKCYVSTGSFGTNITGVIVRLLDNWIEVETKRGKKVIVNADYIQSLREV